MPLTKEEKLYHVQKFGKHETDFPAVNFEPLRSVSPFGSKMLRVIQRSFRARIRKDQA